MSLVLLVLALYCLSHLLIFGLLLHPGLFSFDLLAFAFFTIYLAEAFGFGIGRNRCTLKQDQERVRLGTEVFSRSLDGISGLDMF
jgi:hypothetical protein